MLIFLWFCIAFSGLAVTVLASRLAVRHAVALAKSFRVSAFVVGLILVSLGTDFPEIANSIVSAATAHGNICLGDATGSVFVQITLALGLLPFFGKAFRTAPRTILPASILTLGGLAAVALFSSDGHLAKWEGAMLCALWLGCAALLWRLRPSDPEEPGDKARNAKWKDAAITLAALVGVGGGAGVVVLSVAKLSVLLGIPEYAISFFGAAVGTSLPEIVVGVTAAKRGHYEIAIGNILGSCLIDATLVPGIGPMLFGTIVDRSGALQGTAIAASGMLIAGLLLVARKRHDRFSGAALVGLYLLSYLWLPGMRVTP